MIDQYVKETGPSAARDWAKWSDEYLAFGRTDDTGAGNFATWGQRQDFTSHDEEVAYVRRWVDTRWKSLVEGGVP